MDDLILYTIRPVEERDQGWIPGFVRTLWGDEIVVVHEDVFYPSQLPAYIAVSAEDQVVGLVTYQIRDDICEIITMNSLVENQGVGSKLIAAVVGEARKSGCCRLSVTTTNDNQRAIDFYTSRGFELREVRKGAVERAREIKPSIPTHSPEGIPLIDEWVFEMLISRTEYPGC